MNASIAAIQFALTGDDGLTWLRLWNEGEFDRCRKEWPEAPAECYVGADPLAYFEPNEEQKKRIADFLKWRGIHPQALFHNPREEQAKPISNFDFPAHLQRQRAFSEKAFGPGPRTKGITEHIRKELLEIEAAPNDLGEWIDVILLALDGAWRCGGTPDRIIDGIVAKQTKNEGRTWPDWRLYGQDKAVEHDRSKDVPVPPEPPPTRHLVDGVETNASKDATFAWHHNRFRKGI